MGLPNSLGFNPQEASNRFTGDWALRILLATLSVSPLVLITRMKGLLVFRRMLGLFSFFYAGLHIVSYVALDKLFLWAEIWADIVKRSYITVGMVAFVLMLLLALTSNQAAIKRLGGRQWQRLHKLVYLAAGLVIIHFIMMRKGLQYEPLVYGFILCGLLAFRVRFIQQFLRRKV